MSLRSSTGHLQISNTVANSAARPASTTTWGYFGIGKINSNLSGVGVLVDATFDGGGDAAVAYQNGGDGNAYNANILGGSANNLTVMPSRPGPGDWFAFILDQFTSGGNQRFAWYNLSNPAGFVSTTIVGLTSAQAAAFFNQSLTSNSNPTDMDVACWRCTNTPQADLNDYLTDLATNVSSIADVFDFELVDASTWTEHSGSGATAATQGGTLSTGDTYTFPGLPASADQEGFRFGLDDGSESAHTWSQSQDANDTAAVGTARLIRALINGTGDLASAAYTLRYQKNGAGGYLPVPVGPGSAEAYAQPTWGAVGTGASGTTTANPSYPTGISSSTSKLIAVCTGRSDTANSSFTAPAGWTSLGQFEGGTGTFGVDTGTRRVGFFIKDTVTGSESGTTGNFGYTAGSTNSTLRVTIHRVEVPAGYSLDTEFVSGADTTNGTGYSAAASANATFDSNRLLLVGVAQNIDTGTLSSLSITATGITFGTLSSRSSTAVTNGNDHRHILYSVPVSSGSGTVAPTFAYTISASGSGPTGFLVLRARLPAVVNEIFIEASANITDGEATTARLTPPATKTTGDFLAGKRGDTSNGLTVDVTVDDYTELEWRVNTQSPAVDSAYYDLRVYAGVDPLASYGVTPRVTLGTSGPTIIQADGVAAAAAQAGAATGAVVSVATASRAGGDAASPAGATASQPAVSQAAGQTAAGAAAVAPATGAADAAAQSNAPAVAVHPVTAAAQAIGQASAPKQAVAASAGAAASAPQAVAAPLAIYSLAGVASAAGAAAAAAGAIGAGLLTG